MLYLSPAFNSRVASELADSGHRWATARTPDNFSKLWVYKASLGEAIGLNYLKAVIVSSSSGLEAAPGSLLPNPASKGKVGGVH